MNRTIPTGPGTTWEAVAPTMICPVCGAGFTANATTLSCANGHTFDIAREGYVNLRPARGKTPALGDTREMLLARRRFLERGHYRPLSRAVNAVVAAHLNAGIPPQWATQILDAGCGDGYYLGNLQESIGNQVSESRLIHYLGFDVAKDAVRLAARRYPDARFAVADVNGVLPFAGRSIDVLLNVFAPRNPPEFRRVLATGGALVVVIPTPNHLRELRQSLPLLGIQPEKRERLIEQLAGSFSAIGGETVESVAVLEGEEIRDLVWMTPSGHHLGSDDLTVLQTRPQQPVTFSFDVILFGTG